MNLIENLLEREQEDKDIKVSDDMRIQYIRLKCRFEPESLVKILDLYKFPLEKSMEICQELGLKHALAHIKSRLGKKQHAIDEHLGVVIFCFFSSNRLSKTRSRVILASRLRLNNANDLYQMLNSASRR